MPAETNGMSKSNYNHIFCGSSGSWAAVHGNSTAAEIGCPSQIAIPVINLAFSYITFLFFTIIRANTVFPPFYNIPPSSSE